MTWNEIKKQIEEIQTNIRCASEACKPSRECSLVLTKLDEARMWAHEAMYQQEQKK